MNLPIIFLGIAAKANSKKNDPMLPGWQAFLTTFHANYFFSHDKEELIPNP